jgi:hypothetical protein
MGLQVTPVARYRTPTVADIVREFAQDALRDWPAADQRLH